MPDASGLFNLMRNLGGAIGFAPIDTVYDGRAPVHAAAILERLRAGDAETAAFIGVPPGLLGAPLDPSAFALLQPLVEKAAMVQSINEAWALVSFLTVAALAAIPFARRAGRL